LQAEAAAEQVTDNTHHNQLVQLAAEDHVNHTQALAVAEEQEEQVDMHSAHTITTTGIFVQDIHHTLQLEMKEHQLADKVSLQIALPIKVAAVAMEVQDCTDLAEAAVAEATMVQETVQTVEETAETLQIIMAKEATEHKVLMEQAAEAAEQIMVEHQDVVVMEHALLHIG
jgi:DNA-binding transcriptional regulator PaaX